MGAVSEFEDKVNSILNDPQQMEKIAGLAKSLMGGETQQGVPESSGNGMASAFSSLLGGDDNGFDIGGADSNVIKNPLTQEPYIPGSSIKGKLQSLLKYAHGKVEGDDIALEDEEIQNIFKPVENKTPAITRAIFRDCKLTRKSSEELQSKLGTNVFTEIKAENKINAIKGTADSPRFIERVPAGAVFEGEIVLNIFDGDDEEKMKKAIEESLSLLEHNYLGGSGSRGYGRVNIKDKELKDVMKNETL